jgi:hypothetical protein
MNLKDLEARKAEFELGLKNAQEQIVQHKEAINTLSARMLATKGALEDIDYWIASLKKVDPPEVKRPELIKKNRN